MIYSLYESIALAIVSIIVEKHHHTKKNRNSKEKEFDAESDLDSTIQITPYPMETTPFQHQWTVASAMEILQHPTVDSELWAEAVEWLLLYGPPEIKGLLQEASGQATQASFPELKAQRYAPDGSPCYDITELARSLGISEEEAQTQLKEKEIKHGVQHGFSEEDTTRLQ